MPPKSSVTENERFEPFTLPSAILISIPSIPAMVPVSVAPSALNVKATGKSPPGVETDPVHFPSTGSANTAAAHKTNPNHRALIRMRLIIGELHASDFTSPGACPNPRRLPEAGRDYAVNCARPPFRR